jgi:hypothetical protein
MEARVSNRKTAALALCIDGWSEKSLPSLP